MRFPSKRFSSIGGKFRDSNLRFKTCCAKRKSLPLEITVSLNSASVSINLSTVTFENCFLLFGSVQINLNKFLVSDFQEAFK